MYKQALKTALVKEVENIGETAEIKKTPAFNEPKVFIDGGGAIVSVNDDGSFSSGNGTKPGMEIARKAAENMGRDFTDYTPDRPPVTASRRRIEEYYDHGLRI
jgi:hypothetical protein